MGCRNLLREEFAEKYLNHQLDPDTRDEFEVHILECANCREHVEALLALRQELSEIAPAIRAYPHNIKPQ